jgi:hypoxanthine phosphoribosyltransferase/molybdopterin converting factor small subunit
MVAVILPRSLAALIPGVEHRTTAPGTTVGEVIAALDARWPGLSDRLCEAGPRIRDHINVYVDGERTTALDAAIPAGATIHVIPAIAGGAGAGAGAGAGPVAAAAASPIERDIVSWAALDGLVAGLAEQVRGEYDAMLAITRGGMVPAGMLAYRLGIRDILVAAVAYYDDTGTPGPEPTFLQFPADPLLRGRRILIVDEVWDSGATIVAVTDRVRMAGGIPTTAVVHYKPGRSVVAAIPDHFPVSTDAWVVYPFKAGR